MVRKILFVLLVFVSSSASFSQLRFSAQLGVGVPTTEFAEDAGTGLAVSGTFEYVQKPISYTFNLGFVNFGFRNQLPKDIIDRTWSVIPVMLGLRYYMSAGGAFHPYFGAELGINIINVSITEIRDKVNVEYSESESKFGFNPIFGFRYTAAERMDLELTFKYHVITSEPSTTFFGIMTGLSFGL